MRNIALYSVHYSFKKFEVKIETVTILEKNNNLNEYDLNSINADCSNLEVKIETWNSFEQKIVYSFHIF